MKKVWPPILLLLGLVILLAAAAYFYERRWGLEGPFPSQHHHPGDENEEAEHHSGHTH